MIPQTRSDFTAFCLRKLGAPVIQMQMSELQVDDCVDQALYFWQQNHMDGNIRGYFMYQIQPQDLTNKSITTVPSNIVGVVRMFPIGQALSSDALFNMRYQFIMNDLYSLTNVSLIPYFMVMSHISQLEEILVGEQPVRYNRHQNIIYLDCDVAILTAGTYLCFEVFTSIDPTVYPAAWKDKFLQDYAVALMRRQLGENLGKYNFILPSGITLNGQKIWDQGNQDVLRLEEKCIKDYSIPSAVFIM